PDDLQGAERLERRRAAGAHQPGADRARPAAEPLQQPRDVAHHRPHDPLQGGERGDDVRVLEQPRRRRALLQVRGDAVDETDPARRQPPQHEREPDPEEQPGGGPGEAGGGGERAHRSTRTSSGSRPSRISTWYASTDAAAPTTST